jgi:hypothetical protein
MDIVLWNQSPKLEDSDGQLIAEACDLQMQQDVAPAYGLQPSPRVSFFSSSTKREKLPGNCLVIIFAVDPQRADELAGVMPAAPARAARLAGVMPEATTRDLDDSGRNFARVYPGTILDNDGTLSTGARSISAATSHECIEATYDKNVAQWVWNENARKLVAAEVCDQVEEDAYPKHVQGQDVAVSNFVYRAWFDVRAPAGTQFDHMNLLNAPFSSSEGGYLIVYDPATPAVGVHTEPPQQDVPWGWNAKSKSDGFARTRVRLVW